MRNTFSTQIYCRPSKADRNGMSPLELSIIINGKRVFLNLPYRAKASDFNRKRRPKELQEYVNATLANINTTLTEMAKFGIPVTASTLREYLRNGGFRPYSVEDMFNDFLKMMKGRIGIDFTSGAYRKYELVKELFFSFHSKDKEATSVTHSVVSEFYVHLQNKYNTDTSASYMAKFKRVVVYAIDNGWLKVNPFANIKIKHGKKVIDYLTGEELEKIRTAKIDNECLNSVREAFLLQCYSGLSYIDLEHLREEDIKEDNQGLLYINKERVKTGVKYTSVILPEGKAILEKNNYRMKVISNQKMNLYLKQVMVLSGINHTLTTHLGRKTYGHILLNDYGIRMESVARCLGHSNSRTTAKYYAEVSPTTVINEVATALA